MWTTTGPKLLMPKLDVTIGLRVSFLFVCEIAVHSISTSPENWAFVDREGLNNRLMATNQTLCCPDFRNDVMRRDGPSCVVTQLAEEGCDAVHLIPQSKGNEVSFVINSHNYWMMLFQYIKGVIKCRSPGDNSAPPRGVGIDDVRNGMMLQKTLHLMLGKGAVAFMKV
jgi:HNH endonuclease